MVEEWKRNNKQRVSSVNMKMVLTMMMTRKSILSIWTKWQDPNWRRHGTCKWSHLISFKSLHLEDLQVFALNVQAFFLRTVLSSALQFKNSLCKICNLYHHYQDWRIVRSAISIDKTFTMKYPITEDPGFKKNLIISLSLLPVFSPYNWLFELPLNARNMATENN